MTEFVPGGSIAIEVDRLTKRYDKVDAISDISFQIKTGEIFGLLGPNGSGKTTTTRILITVLKPTSGSARVHGFDVWNEATKVRRIIGYVPQERAIDRFLTGREHLLLLGDLYHLPKQDTLLRIDEILKLVNLEGKADERARDYSGGMKRKLDIACGLIPDPKVLFMDEPTLGLDIESRLRIWEHVRGLKERGITVVMTTNYLDEADQLCDRIAIIDEGKVQVIGSPQDLKADLGGDGISLALMDSEHGVDALMASLNALPGIRGVHINDTGLDIRVDTAQAALPRVLEAVAKSGHGVEAIDYHRPRLDDVFVRHTGHAFRNEEPKDTDG
jgi:ABC-2 type transport system ATP-binding protein